MSGWKKTIQQKQKTLPEINELFKEYSESKDEIIKGHRLGIYGESGVGKTRFILTAPRPIFIIDTELGVRETLYDYARDHDIDGIKCFEVLVGEEQSDGTIKADVDKSLKNIEIAATTILKFARDNPDVKGTIAIDSMSDVWDWLGQWLTKLPGVKLTSSGKPQQLEWQHANERYLQLLYDLLMLYEEGWHVILTGRLKEDYIGAGIKTGEVKGAWQKWTQHWVSIVIFMFKEYYFESDEDLNDPVKRKLSKKFKRGALIEKCRLNGNIEGMVYYDLDWDTLIGDIYGND